MVNSIRKRRKIGGEQSTLDEGGIESTNLVNSKLDKMAWINFYKHECQIKTAKGNKKSMKQIRDTWNTLSMDEKCKYNMPKEDIVDEKGNPEEAVEDNKAHPFDTRCTPLRFSDIVSILTDLQKDAVRELGFSNLLMLKCGMLRRDLCRWLVSKLDTTNLSIELHGKSFTLDTSVFSHIMGISDGGDIVHVDGDVNDVWFSRFRITNRGIKLRYLEQRLRDMKTTDDDFKITFCLYLLGTILAPAAGEFVDSRYLNVLGDVKKIRGQNWARWCLDQLVIGIEKFNSKRSRYITGCLLFLQLFYFHIVAWQPPIVDKHSLPVVSWTFLNIKKCMKQLHRRGCYGTAEVSVNEYVAPATPSDNSDKAEHHIPNDSVLQLVLKEMQNCVKEIQQFRTEHIDLVQKFDRLEEKVDILHRKINMDEGKKGKDGFVPSKEQQAPKSDDDDAVVAKDFDFKFDDDHAPEHTFIPSLMDEKKRNTIVKTLAEQSSTSINVVKNTRTSNKRKPSQYQLSPYEYEHQTGKSSKFQYGPFRITSPLKTLDAQIIEYVFSMDLSMSETIVATSRIIVNRKSFRTLAPTEWVDSEIISLVADNNTRTAKRKRASLYWYLPTQFAYISLTSKDGRMARLAEIHSTFKEDYMYDLHRCELLISLDYVLATERNNVFGPSFTFESFSIVSPVGPTQPNEFDCGVFVCMFLNDWSLGVNREIIATYNSENQRLLLARQLATYYTNTRLDELKQNAIQYHSNMQHVELDTTGNKRPLPPLKLSRRAKVVKTLS